MRSSRNVRIPNETSHVRFEADSSDIPNQALFQYTNEFSANFV